MYDKYEQELKQDTVTVARIKQLLTTYPLDDDAELTFTFINSFLFPDAYDRIMRYGQEQYTHGYIDGKKSNEN